MKNEKLSQKIITGMLASLMFLVIMAMPIVAAAAPVAVPVQAVGDFFKGIGDFILGSNKDGDDLIELIQFSLDQDETKEAIYNTYNAILSTYKLDTPAHYYVVIQYLSGIDFEDMNEELVRSIVDASINKSDMKDSTGKIIGTNYEVASIDTYTARVKEIEPFKTIFSNVTSQTLAQVIDAVGSIETHLRLPQELLDKYEGVMIYPHTKHFRVTTEFGEWYDPEKDGTTKEHLAIDIGAPCGTPIYASSDGTVKFTNVNAPVRSWGNYIAMITEEDDLVIRLFHLQSTPAVGIEQKVKKGDYLGLVGNTGYSFGCHLHFEMLKDGVKINPRQFINFDNLD